jgi:hypothetical protein
MPAALPLVRWHHDHAEALCKQQREAVDGNRHDLPDSSM